MLLKRFRLATGDVAGDSSALRVGLLPASCTLQDLKLEHSHMTLLDLFLPHVSHAGKGLGTSCRVHRCLTRKPLTPKP